MFIAAAEPRLRILALTREWPAVERRKPTGCANFLTASGPISEEQE
jgi:hypothetical protein